MELKMKSKQHCSCCTTTVTVIIFTIIGVILVVAGGIMIPEFKKMINNTIKEQVKLKNGSQSYDLWHKPTSPIHMTYYVFDLNNKDEVMKGGKPNVTQKGPYVYREARINNPVHWSDNGNQLTYLQDKWYYYVPELSCINCTPDDEILTVNIPVMTIANMTKSLNGTVGKQARAELQMLMSMLVSELFHKLTVKEILWGYEDTFLKMLKSMADQKIAKSIEKLLNMSLADMNPFIQLQYNGTSGANNTGTLSIYTGKDNADKVQDTYSWKGERIMSHWKNPNGTTYGNMVNGTDGTHFHPFVKRDDVLYVFIPDICRSMYVNFDEKLTYKGIDLLRFTTRKWLFMKASVNKANEPFCVPKCFKSGLLPVGQCLPLNPPVFMSSPHFYQGDPSLVDDIIGLYPDKEKHATFLSVEPLTGVTMKVYKRLQANLMMEQVPQFTVTGKINSMMYPIMYIEEAAVISDADAATFKKEVYQKITITKVTQYGLIVIGVLFLIASLSIYLKKRRTVSDKEPVGERTRLIRNGNQDL